MKYLNLAAAIASLINSIIAAIAGEWGFALGLFGGFGAWTILAANKWDNDA